MTRRGHIQRVEIAEARQAVDGTQLRFVFDEQSQLADGAQAQQQLPVRPVEWFCDTNGFNESKTVLPVSQRTSARSGPAADTALVQISVNTAVPPALVALRDLFNFLFDAFHIGPTRSIGDHIMPHANDFTSAVSDVFEVIRADEPKICVLRISCDC